MAQARSRAPKKQRWNHLSLAERDSFKTKLGTVVVEDCLDTLRKIPSNSIDLVLTSPPYDRRPHSYGDGEKRDRAWYEDGFLKVTGEILRVLKRRGSFILNYRSRRESGERGTLQYELVLWLQDQGFFFAEDFIWGKPSPPPGKWRWHLKDAVEYCFQFTKTDNWQFFPEHCLLPARWDAKDRARRKLSAHNYERETYPSGHGRSRVTAGPDMVRPSTLLHMEPEFGPNPTSHPARFPVGLPTFFIKLLTKKGQLVYDPFAGTCTTAVAAESLERKWLMSETNAAYIEGLRDRLETGR